MQAALHDPTRKTSINSLLNPQDASDYPRHGQLTSNLGTDPLLATHAQPHATALYPSYDSGNTYNLRTADWEDGDVSSGPKIAQGSEVQPYQTQHSHGMIAQQPMSNDYAYTSRAIRSSIQQPQDQSSGQVMWPHDQDTNQTTPPNMSYSHSQTNERAVLAGDYSNQSSYPSTNYQEQVNTSVWQTGSRASTRIVAKATTPSIEPQRHGQPSYYGQQFTPQQSYNGSLQSYSQSHVSHITVGEPSTRLSVEGEHPTSPSPSSASKRKLSENDSISTPKAKRPKAKSKSIGTETKLSTPGPSKRGYPAKKRSEAAFIAAQNEALQNALAQGQLPPSVIDEKTGMSLIPELQFARCMSSRYKTEDFPRCVSCIRRWQGDTCRFQGIRYFMRDAQRNLRATSFSEVHQASTAATVQFPGKWNRNFDRVHLTRTKLSIAKALLPTLRKEQEHIQVSGIVRRPRETEVRATCDTCITSIFATSFMCRLCGREICNDCYQQVCEITPKSENPSEEDVQAFAVRRERYSHANPFFLACTKRLEHGASHFSPVTRFIPAELDKAVQGMEELLRQHGQDDDNGKHPTLVEYPSNEPRLLPTPLQYVNAHQFPDPLTHPIYDSYVPVNEKPHILDIPVYHAQIIPASYYDPPSPSSTVATSRDFSSLWRKSLPLLVKDVLPRFRLLWDPASFIKRYGEAGCLVVECQTDQNQKITIKEFFDNFGKYEGRKHCLKLKDWPTNEDFKTACPELYEDFSNAVPVPDYVRRDGVFNIGSHFPTNVLGPDLGPKMYNSFASTQDPGSKGSTRLHMDMADALNVMLHAEPCPDGTEGYAVWDLYRAEDSDKIREFLKKRFGYNPAVNGANLQAANKNGHDKNASQAPPVRMIGHDGIHSQQFYLDVELRRTLWEECGVKSYRIYQRPGDGIFIPAGCAHQVANMSDCMKIAIDFVSPENIDKCEKLTKEFREQNQSKVWKEDVLQLRSMMWFAWQSCCDKEEKPASSGAPQNEFTGVLK